MKLLLVDDEVDFLTLMQKLIESWGHEVVALSSAAAALEAFRKEQPDAVILDYVMPELNGLELLKKIREMDRRVPAIMFTAQPTIKAMETGRELGITAFIPKFSSHVDIQEDLKIALDLLQK